MTHTFHTPHLVTHLEIWQPRYSSQYKEGGERVALLAKYKVDHGSSWIIIEFTKAHHLDGQRYCIQRSEAQNYPLDSNGTIPCYAVPMSALQGWDTAQEIKDTIDSFGWI